MVTGAGSFTIISNTFAHIAICSVTQEANARKLSATYVNPKAIWLKTA